MTIDAEAVASLALARADAYAVERTAVGADEGAVLLDDVRAFLARFVAFPSPGALDAVTLWIVHAHLVDAGESTPRLAVLSPEPGSGKTRTLEILELLTPNPMSALSASTAATFRSLAKGPRTLLFDEVDAIFGRRGKDDPSEDLRALLNAGHRKGAMIPRCVGPTHDVQEFPVFAACALAGLGDLPDTLMSRAVIVRMRKRLPSEAVEPFRHRVHAREGWALRDRLAEWCGAVSEDVRDAWPSMPPGVTDRPADVWEPLLAVADAAGGHWPITSRAACTALAKAAENREASLGVRLLSDLRQVFADSGVDRLSTDHLLVALGELSESPWGNLHGKGLDARGLAARLRQFEVRSQQLKVDGAKVRGYALAGAGADDGATLHDAFRRYLPPDPGFDGTSGTSGTGQVSDVNPVPSNDSLSGTRYLCGTPAKPVTRAVPQVPQVPSNGGGDRDADEPAPDDTYFLSDEDLA